jgi:hypothetical protein
MQHPLQTAPVLFPDVGVVAPTTSLCCLGPYWSVASQHVITLLGLPASPTVSCTSKGEQPHISSIYTWIKFFATLSFCTIC